ncbi:hypothetical protein [Variovorax sp. PBL-E5]|uniref:hypothetical protein n=1 Tax=Variovorax sp. PBL-E5 TaxID=434014 RepID=UPI001316A1D5|nr:hypothetical protein [Variovorax sp. PBL-E5]VTU25560.1 hypothetical protein E5CHR_02021 [Variovorax sp. PBL-E5]
MKNIVLALLIGLSVAPLWAQTSATVGNTDLGAERDRLAQERRAAEAKFSKEEAACYKKFAVEGCLEEARRQRRVETDNIKRQETEINDIERKRRGAAELDRLEQNRNGTRPPDAADKREQSIKSQQDREQRAADHATSRAAAASETAERQREFDNKQREHAEHEADAANRRAQAPIERARYEDKLQRAADHKADVERHNAGNTKPRSAPLPTPP